MRSSSSFRTFGLSRFVSACVLYAFFVTPVSIAAVIFVDDDAPTGGNGAAWPSAFKYLQDALSVSLQGDEIRVAQGTYKPDRDSAYPGGTGDRTATFQLRNGVTLVGGFAGLGAPNPNARDISSYPTILSGDLAGNDGPNFANTGENSYHVVTGSGTDATAVLDGFTVKAGNANGAGNPNDKGAGMLNISGSPTIRNCIIALCQSNWNGAGVINTGGSRPTFTDCVFQNNLVQRWGGAMTTESGCEVRITSCTFQNNTANSDGGALDNYGAAVRITGCTFTANHANGSGGAVQFNGSAVAIVANCVFTANSSGYGAGALLFTGSSTGEAHACVFEQNSSLFGGALAIWSGSSPQVTDCRLLGNAATGDGGGVNVNGVSPTFRNCLLAGNYCAGYGGAVTQWNGNTTLAGCTIVDNRSNATSPGGGGLQIDGGGSMTISDAVLWNNADVGGSGQPAQVRRVSGTVTINYSCVEGWDGTFGGTGNVGFDPLFVDPDGPDNNLATWQDNDYHLGAESPCIDTGDTGYVPQGGEADLDGYPRICGATCRTDIGSYEYGASADSDCNFNGISDACDIANGTSLDVFDALPNGYANAANADVAWRCQEAPEFPGYMAVQPISSNGCSYMVNHATIAVAALSCTGVDLDLSIVHGVHVYGFELNGTQQPDIANMRKDLALYQEYIPLVPEDFVNTGLYYNHGATVWGLELDFAEMSIDGAEGEQLWFGLVFEPVSGACPDGDGFIGVPVSDVTHASTGYDSAIIVSYGDNGPVDIGYVAPAYTNTDGILAMHLFETTPGDFDGDGYVSVADFTMFGDCLAGPETNVPQGCQAGDLNGDGDVDLVDFAKFQRAFSGAGG